MTRPTLLLIFVMLSGICLSQYTEPQPVIGQKALKSMIKRHIVYPEKDINEKNEGTVSIDFTADKTGTVISYKVTEGVSNSIDSAAISLFELIVWEPPTHDMVPVEGPGEFKIKFNLKQYNRLVKKRGYNSINLLHNQNDSSLRIYKLKELTKAPVPILSNKNETLNGYIYSNLVYPDAAYKTGIDGDVEIVFIIEKNGLPSNVHAVKHLGGGCTGEAIRIVESIKWYPGLLDNMAVRTQYIIKIRFKRPEGKDNYIPNQQGSGI